MAKEEPSLHDGTSAPKAAEPERNSPETFWKPWESEIPSFDDALKLIHGIFNTWAEDGRIFAWRGQTDASWGLQSSLSRACGIDLTEAKLAQAEEEVLKRLHRWGLHFGHTGRLSVLHQLAMLQHYGAPTRLIDISFNPLIGLWFAVEEKFNSDGSVKHTDSRLFALDVTERRINENDDKRGWEDDLHRPWPRGDFATIKDEGKRDAAKSAYTEWCKSVFAWIPPRLDHRIAAQNGGFIFGGVPQGIQHPKTTVPTDGQWTIGELRKATIVPLRIHKLEPTGNKGPDPRAPAYTMRITAEAKIEIRERLERLYGFKHSTIYPDFSGFALHGVRKLLK